LPICRGRASRWRCSWRQSQVYLRPHQHAGQEVVTV